MACVPSNCNSSMIGAFRFLLFSIFTLFSKETKVRMFKVTRKLIMLYTSRPQGKIGEPCDVISVLCGRVL